MKYALLIYVDEAIYEHSSQAEREALMTGYGAFGEKYKGAIIGGEALRAVATATTVRVRDGKALTTDGPFAETKEQFGGYYVVEAKDLDEATQIASAIPDAASGSIEIRPVMVFG